MLGFRIWDLRIQAFTGEGSETLGCLGAFQQGLVQPEKVAAPWHINSKTSNLVSLETQGLKPHPLNPAPHNSANLRHSSGILSHHSLRAEEPCKTILVVGSA